MKGLFKIFSGIGLAIAVIVAAPVRPAFGAAEEAAAIAAQPVDRAEEIIKAADALVGEELVYHISFWVFQDMAVGKVTFTKDENGEYVARLDARTIGMVDKVLQHRHDIYTSRLILSEDGSMFVTKSFKKSSDINGKVREGVKYIDYKNRILTWMSWGGGKEDKSGGSGFPEGVYPVDPLTAFYNFRLGVYGPAEEGREYRIHTFPKDDKVPELYMRITTREEMDKRTRRRKAPAADYLADAKVDKEFFGSGNGELEILFTGGLLPVRAVAKDVAFFGDVTGTLKQVGVNMDFKLSGSAKDAAGWGTDLTIGHDSE